MSNNEEPKTIDSISDDNFAKIEDVINGSNNVFDILNTINDYRTKNNNEATIKREDLAMYIIQMSNEKLDEVYWAETVETIGGKVEKDNIHFYKDSNFPTMNFPISLREIILSQLTGRPYPSYMVEGIMDFRGDAWKNKIREPKEEEMHEVELYKQQREERNSMAKDNPTSTKGKVKFGYHLGDSLRDYQNTGDRYYPGTFPEKMDGELVVSKEELILAGLDPEKMAWEEERDNSKVFPEDIASADKNAKLTTTEVGLFRRIMDKIQEKFKGKGE